MDQNSQTAQGNHLQGELIKRDLEFEPKKEEAAQTVDFIVKPQVFQSEKEPTHQVSKESTKKQGEVVAELERSEVICTAKREQNDHLKERSCGKKITKGRARDTEQLQSDSAQDEDHRHDRPETLEHIFASAALQGLASIEPQEMEEHRLEKLTIAIHSSDDEQYPDGEPYQQEYIDEETINALCSPFLSSPASREQLCMPAPNYALNRCESSDRQETNPLREQEQRLLFHNIEEKHDRMELQLQDGRRGQVGGGVDIGLD